MSVVLKIVVKGKGKERGHLSNTVSCYYCLRFSCVSVVLKNSWWQIIVFNTIILWSVLTLTLAGGQGNLIL